MQRFRGLRGRLSYANVMATLAFFFALTGGAVAATGALKATDPITAGDLAGSTYGTPIIADGAVQGYVLAQFAFTVEPEKIKELSTKPDAILVDEAFKLIYAGEAVDFRHLRRADVDALSKILLTNVNKRLGQPLVHNVLVQQLNYLPRDQLRGNG